MEIEFRDLSYTVRKHFNIVGEKKKILKNISGKFMPGELCAILGSSGAGKTSLLHALAGYRKAGVSGSFLVNDTPRNEKWFRRRSCYITQEELLPTGVTVYEILHMAARLKGVSKEIAIDVLTQVGLTGCEDTKIECLSGGQRRRTAVALELLTGTRGAEGGACFLDEPCSGLDDVAASKMQRLLRRLASSGRTVAVTLHQPSASALALYHRLYVVAAGRCVYHGPPQALVTFLASLQYYCPLDHNPADFLIELVDNNPENINRLSNAIDNGKIYFEGTTSSQIPEIIPSSMNMIKEFSIQENNGKHSNNNFFLSTEEKTNLKNGYPISSYQQFSILLERHLKHTIRNTHSLLMQAIHYSLCTFLIVSCFYDTAENGALMFSHLKFFVAISLFFSYTRLLAPIIMIPGEIKMAKKEHFNRWYSLTPYFFATTLASLPIQFIYNFMFMSIVYYATGMPLELWRFSMFIVISNMLSIATDGLGVAVASVFRPVLGLVIGPSISSIFLGLAIYGFDFAKQIDIIMQWLMRSSPTRVGLSSFAIVAFGWGRKKMKCDEVYCFFADPKKLLDFLGGKDTDLYIEMGCLFVLMMLFRIVAYLALKWRFRVK